MAIRYKDEDIHGPAIDAESYGVVILHSIMAQVPTVNKYRPQAGQSFPFPKYGSDWTLEELNYIGIDHKVDCALDEIIPPKIVVSPMIIQFFTKRLNKTWEDLINSEVKEDRESFYARLLQVAGPKPKGGPYDIPYMSSQPSESTPPPEIEKPRTPEGDPSPIQPPRPSPQHTHPSGYLSSSPVSPTPAKKTGDLPEATPQPSSDPSYEGSSPQRAESDSDLEEDKDLAERDVEALARSLLHLIEAALLEVLPRLETETQYAKTIRP